MSDFYKKFLTEDLRRLSPAGRFIGLAAFGKHPGWDDHVEDFGLETESLITVKTALYVNGIGGQIDAGAWRQLDAATQIAEFKHVFLWKRGSQFLLGRMWSSSDGKGRTSYPMVVCVHCAGLSLDFALKHVLPVLEELERVCMAVTTAEEVREVLNRKRASLREILTSGEAGGGRGLPPDELSRIVRAETAANADAFPRVLYQLQSQMSAFAPGKFNARGSALSLRSQHLRLPLAAANPEQAILFWSHFLATQVDPAAPLLLVLPCNESWLDVIAGEPESAQVFCLKASPKAVSLVSEVPYSLSETFRAQSVKFLTAFQAGEATAADLPTPSDTAFTSAGASDKKSGWFKWIGISAFLAVAATFLLFKSSLRPTRAAANGTRTNSPVIAQATANVPPSPRRTNAAPLAQSVRSVAPGETEAARLVAEQKNAEAMAAARKLKADAESAALREKERQAAEARRLEVERLAAAQKQEEERAKAQAAAAVAAVAAADAKKKETSGTIAAAALSMEQAKAVASPLLAMTNSIGMTMLLLPSGLYVSKYEVTQAEYQQVLGTNPSNSRGEQQPVEKVTWNDAVEFCRRLTERERATLRGKVYTLPTEKQWEDFLGGQKISDLQNQNRSQPSPVGTTGPANKFGLFDVLGNVWEWTLDGVTAGEKLLKGGAYNSMNLNRTMLPEKGSVSCGFRCVLTTP